MIQQGKEMGTINDIVFNRKNTKQSSGAVGILTDNVIDRFQLYEHAIILALIPFKKSEIFHK